MHHEIHFKNLTFREFCIKYDLYVKFEHIQNPFNESEHISATLEHESYNTVEIRVVNLLHECCEHAKTEELALKKLKKSILGAQLVIGAFTEDRRAILVPTKFYD